MRYLRAIAAALGVVLIIAYPVTVYVGLSRWSPRAVGLAILIVVVASFALRLTSARAQHVRALLPVPMSIIGLAALSAWLNNPTFVLFTPALINASLLATFGVTLRPGAPMPLVERFARLQHDDLSAGELRWCRQVTIAWCGFFGLNIGATVLLALAAPVSWWALYTGAIAYVLMGALVSGEYVTRKYRFGRFSDNPVDRALALVMPKRASR